MTTIHIPAHLRRYDVIHESLRDVSDDELEFADYLRSKERSCCPDGYVDSDKFQYQYKLRSPGFDVNKSIRPEGARTPRGPPKVISVSIDRDKFEQLYVDKLKNTEESIRKSKQQQRELKRYEGDVLKHKREVRVDRRDYEKDVAKQQYAEDVALLKNMKQYDELQQEANHQKSTLVHQRMSDALEHRESNLNSGRKVMQKTIGLSRQYRAKMDALKLKRLEVDRLMADYEKRLRLKEEEEKALHRQLEDIGGQLGMEVIRNKVMTRQQLDRQRVIEHEKVRADRLTEMELEDKLKFGDDVQKSSVMKQRRLSADLSRRRDELNMSLREDDRSLIAARTGLAGIENLQKSLHSELYLTDLDRQKAESDRKIAEANDRRTRRAQTDRTRHRQRNQETEEFYSQRAVRRTAQVERYQHEDALRHFQKEVNRGQEAELSLYQRMRLAEAKRKESEQQVRLIQGVLHKTSQRYGDQLIKDIAASHRVEQQTAEALLKAKANLQSVTADREESYRLLQQRRMELEKDREALDRELLEHERLQRVADKTDNQNVPPNTYR